MSLTALVITVAASMGIDLVAIMVSIGTCSPLNGLPEASVLYIGSPVFSLYQRFLKSV